MIFTGEEGTSHICVWAKICTRSTSTTDLEAGPCVSSVELSYPDRT